MEVFNDVTSEFEMLGDKEVTLTLEHSLISLTKWESHWKKPFLGGKKSTEETISYIKFMTITQNVNEEVYTRIPNSVLDKIGLYIEDSMTATIFNDYSNNSKSNSVITSEIIYYWMIKQGIPFTCEKWHLNRLLTLIKVSSIKNNQAEGNGKKMSRADILARNRKLNEMRKAKHQTKG